MATPGISTNGSVASLSTMRHPQTFLRGDIAVYVSITVLVLLAWWVSEQGWFTPWSRTGYWLGVTGGVLMLLLLTYPIRKRWKLAYNWGPARYWFWAHMAMGVLGPWFILLHSGFMVQSLNAAVALYAMLVVALSGVVGRFLFVRLHAELRGHRTSLEQLQDTLNQTQVMVGAAMQEFPRSRAALESLSAEVMPLLRTPGNRLMWRLLVVPLRCGQLLRLCRREVTEVMPRLAAQRHWSKPRATEYQDQVMAEMRAHAQSLQRVVQFQPLEQLFALWHVAHAPFVWIMGACAIFHVIAVHAY